MKSVKKTYANIKEAVKMMPVLPFTRSLFNRNHPSYVIIQITHRCNLNCSFCFNQELMRDSDYTGELSTEEYRRVAQALHPNFHLVLSGGEPFLREDLADIVASMYFISGTRFLAVPTNGVLTHKIIHTLTKILRNCPRLMIDLNLSIDAVGDKHDRMRGEPGTFERIMETVRRLLPLRSRYPALSVNVLTVLTEDNWTGVPELSEYLKKNVKPDFHDIGPDRTAFWEPGRRDFFLKALSTAEKWDAHAAPAGNKAKVQRAVVSTMRSVIRSVFKENKMTFPCLGGRKMIVISPDGRIFPCETLWLEKKRFKTFSSYQLGSFRPKNFNWNKIRNSETCRRINQFIINKRCYCTWECAVFNSVIYCPRYWPSLAKKSALVMPGFQGK